MRHPSFSVACALLFSLSPAFAGDKIQTGLPDPSKEMGQNGNQAGGGPGPGPGAGGAKISANVMSVVKSMGLTNQVAAIVNGDVGAGLSPEVFAQLSKGVFQDAAQKRNGDVQFLINSGGEHFSTRVTTPGPWGPRQYQKDDLVRLGTTVTGTADQSEKIVAVLRNTGQPKLSEEQRYEKLQQLGKQAFGPGWSADTLDGNPNNNWGGRGRAPGNEKGDGDHRYQPGQQGGSPNGHDKDGNAGGPPNLIERFAKFSMAQGLEELIAKEKIPLPRDQDGGGGNPNNGGGTVNPPRPPITPCSLWGGCPIPITPDEHKVDAKDKIIGGDTSGAISSIDKGLANGGGADLLAMRGGLMLDKGQYADAARDAKRALEMDPGNRDALAVLRFSEGRSGASGGGERGFAGGQAAGGAATFGSAARLAAPSGAPAFTPGARFTSEQSRRGVENALKLGDTAGALALASRSLALDPNDPFMLNLRASIYARMKDYKKAAADAAAGLALAPKNAALLRTKGYADLRSGNYKDAMGSANQLLELDGKDSFAFALRGHAYGNLGDRGAMMDDLRRAAELDPRYQQAASGQLQMPSDSDILFLFPGEEGAKPAAAAAAPEGRNKKFGLMVGVSVFGGLLLALGLLQTVLAPLKEQVSSVFTRMTRTGPSVASFGEQATAQPASVNGLLPGLIRGQYEISRQIGQGGMGTVFEGTDRALGRRVAIKKMREELRVNPQERARFVIEAKTVAALHHPNVVDIYAIAEDGQDVFLVFEYVDGKTVHDLVQTSGRLAPKDAAKIVRAGADALAYAHSKGVIHRDMKPSNMMIDGSGRVKVMDFGIARMAKDAMTRYSMTNTVVGTPPYMAPEQEQGQVRRESDVYALAVCAYEMLTGKLPFVGIGAGMLMNKINMSYVPPSRAIAGLPEALDAVFLKAFQALPENRYRTPQEFADALESSLGSGVRA